jgi:hypothetical protein
MMVMDETTEVWFGFETANQLLGFHEVPREMSAGNFQGFSRP